jgi:hypothetical protein
METLTRKKPKLSQQFILPNFEGIQFFSTAQLEFVCEKRDAVKLNMLNVSRPDSPQVSIKCFRFLMLKCADREQEEKASEMLNQLISHYMRSTFPLHLSNIVYLLDSEVELDEKLCEIVMKWLDDEKMFEHLTVQFVIDVVRENRKKLIWLISPLAFHFISKNAIHLQSVIQACVESDDSFWIENLVLKHRQFNLPLHLSMYLEFSCLVGSRKIIEMLLKLKSRITFACFVNLLSNSIDSELVFALVDHIMDQNCGNSMLQGDWKKLISYCKENGHLKFAELFENVKYVSLNSSR